MVNKIKSRPSHLPSKKKLGILAEMISNMIRVKVGQWAAPDVSISNSPFFTGGIGVFVDCPCYHFDAPPMANEAISQAIKEFSESNKGKYKGTLCATNVYVRRGANCWPKDDDFVN